MSRAAISTTTLMLLAAWAPGATAQVFDFEAGADGWEPISGQWAVEDGRYVQSDASTPAYRMSLVGEPWEQGRIEADATPLTDNHNGNVGASFGLVAKHVDDKHWCAARFGSYGRCSLRIQGSEVGVVDLGTCLPDPGTTYHPSVILRGGLVAIALDGVIMGIFHDPFPGQAGRPGLFTETECAFDNVRIEGGNE